MKNNSELVLGCDSKYFKNIRKNTEKGLLLGLRKDTDYFIRHYSDFFDKIANSEIKEIYSFGFSYAEVDMPYIKKICEVLKVNGDDRSMTWFIAPHGKIWKRIRDELYFRNSIKQAGFNGKIRKIY